MFGENIFSVWGKHPSPSLSHVVSVRLTLSFLQNSHGTHSGLTRTSHRDFVGTFKKGDIIIVIITICLDCQLFGQYKLRAPERRHHYCYYYHLLGLPAVWTIQT